MFLTTRKGFHYLRHSFKKNGKTVTREVYLGKLIPENLQELKEALLHQCLQEDVFIKLGRIQKDFGIEWRRYPESIKKKVLLDLSISFTYNTNAIEGSTITEEETEDLLKKRISPNRPLEEVQETLNHSRVFLGVINSNEELSLKKILLWHEALFSETKPDIAGKIRDYHVRVGDYRAPDWQDLPGLLKQFFAWYETAETLHPVELASRAHYRFEMIHPFGDGNGRIGRLLIAQILRKNHYPILVIPYKKRKSYYHALSKTENDFLLYFVRAYLSAFKAYWSVRPQK